MKKSIVAVALSGLVLTGVVALAPAASAHSVDPQYSKMQTGVTYTVYSPTNTLGHRLTGTIGTDWCGKGSGDEQNIDAVYKSTSKSQFSVSEGNPICFDFAVSQQVGTATVLGAKATLNAYCDPASTDPCTRKDIHKMGGNLRVTLPAGKGLRPTDIVIETIGKNPLSYQQLITVAKSLMAVD
jgi:hypothetical protein